MANAEARGRTKGRRVVLFAGLLLALICGLGLAYLGTMIDWDLVAASGRPQPVAEKASAKACAKRLDAGVVPPSFDVAFVDERGKLVAAGRSEAGWIIQLRSKSQILGETRADENNEWVLTPEAALPPGEHTLSLLAIDPSGQRHVAGNRDSRVTVAQQREITQSGLPPAKG